MGSIPFTENGLVELSTMGSHSNPAWRESVHCSHHSGNGIYSIHQRMGWWNFPQWEVIATQRGENGFTVITTVGMGSIPFTGEWVIQKTQLTEWVWRTSYHGINSGNVLKPINRYCSTFPFLGYTMVIPTVNPIM